MIKLAYQQPRKTIQKPISFSGHLRKTRPPLVEIRREKLRRKLLDKIGMRVKRKLCLPGKQSTTDPHPVQKSLEPTGFLQRLWLWIKRPAEPKSVFILVKRNRKVHSSIVESSKTSRKAVIVLDTEPGSSFIRHGRLIPKEKIRKGLSWRS